MDNRKFDSIARSLASGTSRRSVLKGLFGLGGAAFVGSVALDQQADAARRPTPTPKPVTCPGRQTWNGTACICPGDAANKCGPDCCTGKTTDPYPRAPGHSECCDNACCFGTCYGEELCCPTNSTGPESPPTHELCDDNTCVDLTKGGCCDDSDCGGEGEICCGTGVDATCEAGPNCGCDSDEDCNNGCQTCVVSGNTGTCTDACTGERCCQVADDPAAWFCLQENQCCTDSDCDGDDPCTICAPKRHICGPLCNSEIEICCTDAAGLATCQFGNCCVGEPCGDGPESLCCADGEEINFCQQGTCCPDGAGCSGDTPNCCGGETKACCAQACDNSGLCPSDCGEANQTCTEGNECCSGTCCSGSCCEGTCCDGECCQSPNTCWDGLVCATCAPIGATCTDPFACCSGYCGANNTCQNQLD